MRESNYLCPPMWDSSGNRTSEDRMLGWLTEAVREGETFLKNQPAYPDIEAGRRIIEGPGAEKLPAGVSKIWVRMVKRESREIVATESNLRPLWGYKSDNREFHDEAVVLNKLLNSWWQSTFADRVIREALQWAVACGTGYISPIWESEFWNTGRGDIALKAYGPLDVLPVQLPKDRDLQRAYAVIIRTEQPIAVAHAMYPEFADQITPDRSRPGLWRRAVHKARQFAAPALNLRKGEDSEMGCPTVDIYNVYIIDKSINGSGRTVPMGEPGTSWSYEVPSMGSEIPTGQQNSAGQALYRKATREDAALYPLRRLIVATNSVIIQDGPSPWWHAKVPLEKFTVDDWPWTYLGFAPVRDGGAIETSLNRLLRVIDNSANAKLDPALTYDEDVISQEAAERIDTRKPRQRVKIKTGLGNRPLEPLLPAEYYDVPNWVWQHVGKLEEVLKYVMAGQDMANIAKARQLPASDTIEKLLEMAGPIVQDISRNMEKGLRGLGEMTKSLFFQFYTAPRKVQVLGEDAITEEEFQYSPEMIGANGIPPDERMRRLRKYAQNFVFHVTPNSLHQITQMSRKLMMVQLWRGQFPVDPWTVAEALDIPNFGPPPSGTHNVIERWVAWMFMRGEMQTELAKMLQSMPMADAVKQMRDVMGRQPPGRKPTGQKPPRVVTKDQGTRSSIVES